MNLFDELQAVPHTRRQKLLDKILDGMNDEDAAALTAALENPAIPSAHISRVLSSHGWTISPSTVSSHRAEMRGER